MRIDQQRRFVFAAGFVLVLALALGIGTHLVRRPAGAEPRVIPEVLDVGYNEVAIAWRTDTPRTGRVFYQRAGREEKPQSVVESFSPSFQHEVILKDLQTATRYQYWLEGADARYQFQTQPSGLTPFSFLVVCSDTAEKVLNWWMSEMPEFIVSLGKPSAAGNDIFKATRPFVPIFCPAGPDTLARSNPDGESTVPNTWAMEWGGLRLIFVGRDFDGAILRESSSAHTLGLVVGTAEADALLADGRLQAGRIRSAALHNAAVAYNAASPANPVAFVLVPGGRSEDLDVEGVNYLSLPSAALRVDVSPESVTAFFLAEGREVALRKAAIKQKRTCEECRQLADRGAYEESVKAYQEFIATHAGHFQIDDAYLAIAVILDENLFRFKEALEWYRKLQSEYPQSSLTPLAQQRIDLLTAYSDHDFKPLERFERIRKVELARQKGRPEELQKIYSEVEAVLRDYPQCALAPDMEYWLANQYRATEPDRAVTAYRRLIAEFPAHANVRNAWLEIGETYYTARRYREAIRAYQEALAAVPDRADVAQSQIGRGYRNLRRTHLAAGVVAWLLVMAGLAVGWPPVGLAARKLKWAVAAFAPLVAIILFAGWFIHEQFSSLKELFALAGGFAASSAFAFVFASTLADKWSRPSSEGGGWLTGIVGSLLGLAVLVAGAYLTVYLVNEHYLVAIGL